MNVWGLWWFDKALTELHQSPWHTRILNYPLDFSLHGATLAPFNCIMAVPLLRALTLLQTYNLLLIFSFVSSGVSAFLLAYSVTRHWVGSLVGGYLFTFSQYHFAHARGHANLVAMEWLPLFILCWHRLLTKPRVVTGLMAAVALLGVCLSDYYYLTYACLAALVCLVDYAVKAKSIRFVATRPHLPALLAFFIAAAATSGRLLSSFVRANGADRLLGGHNPYGYSLDVPALVVPGGIWRFGALTQAYWSRLPVNAAETSVALGFSVVALLIYTWVHRRELADLDLRLWYAMLAVFLVLALGPALHVCGWAVPFLPLPYRFLMWAVPQLGVSGMPVRMMVVVSLAAAVICAAGVRLIQERSTGPAALAIFLAVVLIEYLPAPIPASQPPVPDYVLWLRQQPRHGALLDVTEPATPRGWALYFQTIHEQPLAFRGRSATARITPSIVRHTRLLDSLVAARDWKLLHDDYGIDYVLADRDLEIGAPFRETALTHQGRRGRLYDLSAARWGDSPRRP